MPRLDWTKQDAGWRAGRYFIEEVAPDVWACSRLRSGSPSIEMIGRSKRELQEAIERRDRKVRSTLRAVLYVVAFGAFAVLAVRSANWETQTAAAVTLLASALATFCFIGIIEAWISRTWEPPPRLPYR